jgi:transcriptional regulator with XRE-family HTH domain
MKNMTTIFERNMPIASEPLSADKAEGLPNIGLRLRYERRARRMRLKDLADSAGCSESLLSRIENNIVMPSLTTLHRLCRALEISVPELLRPPDVTSCVVYRQGDRANYPSDGPLQGDGKAEILVPFEEGRLLEAHIWHVPSKGKWCGPYQHVGEETGYVLNGALELVVNDETHIIRAGDSFFFKSDLSHSYRCHGDEDCRIIWVNTPPTF